MKSKHLVGIVLLCLFGSICLVPSSLYPQESSDEAVAGDFRKLYNDGLDLLKQGEYQKAYEAFEKALRLDPPSEIIRFHRDLAGDAVLKQMLSNPQLRDTAIRILELSKGAMQRWIRNPEQIQALVAQLDTKEFDQKWITINKLVSVGQRACPYLIELLGKEKKEDLHFNAIHCLEKMGGEAVLPVIEALNSSIQLVRQNAAIILGTIKDERAIAELKRVHENSDEKPEVKMYAAEALRKITGRDAALLSSAKEQYYQLAEKYYYVHPSVMTNYYGDYIVWKWSQEEDKLAWQEVPDFLFNKKLAEESCYDAIALDANYQPVLSLLICVHLASYNEANITLDVVADKVNLGEIEPEVQTKLQTDLKPIKNGIISAALGTKKYLYEALQRSLNDNNASVAVSLIRLLKYAAKGDDLPIQIPADKLSRMKPAEQEKWIERSRSALGLPLVNALIHSDKKVRYAAAETLVKIIPKQHFSGQEKVIRNLTDALGERGIRVALVVEDDVQIRNQLRVMLKELNCYTVEAMTAKEGLFRGKESPPKDLIIMDYKFVNRVVFAVTALGKEHTETVFDSLKTDVRSRSVPIILLCLETELEMAKSIYQDKIDGYLVKPVQAGAFKEMVEQVFSSETCQRDSKTRAETLAQRAAETLALIDPDYTVYPYLDALDGLINCLMDRRDEIRLPSLQALACFGSSKAIPVVHKLFGNKENDKPIRVQAAYALAEIFRRTPQILPPKIYETLREALSEDDFEIRRSTAQALGNANLSDEQRREIFELAR